MKTTRNLVLLALVGASLSAQAVVLYEQQPVWTPGAGANPRVSQIEGNLAVRIDDFTLGSSATLQQISWVGTFLGNGSTNSSPNGTWKLALFTDAGSQPGAQVWSATLPVSGTTTLLGQGTTAAATVDIYRATVNTPSLPLIGGQKYWLSVLQTFSLGSYYNWLGGTGGDGQSGYWHETVNGPRFEHAGPDMAFRLEGQPVPEPATLLALGAGAVALVRRRRR